MNTLTEEGGAVWNTYKNKIEGPQFEMPNYFTIGAGAF